MVGAFLVPFLVFRSGDTSEIAECSVRRRTVDLGIRCKMSEQDRIANCLETGQWGLVLLFGGLGVSVGGLGGVTG